MHLPSRKLLRRLGAGESIHSLCQVSGNTRAEFDSWWQQQIKARVPGTQGEVKAPVHQGVRIARNHLGIPSIQANNDHDLFVGLGYAMAQDRLFQLDYLRRRGSGRLSEILGAEGTELDLLTRIPGFRNVFELDRLARTVGIRRIAEVEWAALPRETQEVLEAFSAGVNAMIDSTTEDCWPIEFDLLNYRPERWSPIDCLTIEGELRWYLTGRFPVIVIPELVKRTLGDGPLYQAFLQVESDAESILPPGTYPSHPSGTQPIGQAAGDPLEGVGSNNWVVAGTRTTTGKPMLGSDPHIAFDAVSCWYQMHLCGGSFNVAGMTYVGMPAVMFGGNERVVWGCTNNICSQRDLYQEKTDPDHPNCFLHAGQWEPARTLEEEIRIKNAEPVRITVQFSRNGPIVDEVLPPPARTTGPVSLKWMGAYPHRDCSWLTSLLQMNRARSVSELREAMRPWQVPTFSIVFADVDGAIGYQAVGSIPVRGVWDRGYRPGWDPAHQWQGLIPFEGMPHWMNPERGWVATANNRPAPDDYPYPLSGTWSTGLRAERIRQMMEEHDTFTLKDHVAMQHDSLSLRAIRLLPHLIAHLSPCEKPWAPEVVAHLSGWDGRMEPNRVGATLFDMFFAKWTAAVVAHRFHDKELASLVTGGGAGLAAAVLAEDTVGWFQDGTHQQIVLEVMEQVHQQLTRQLGKDTNDWTWGRLHTLPLRHILSGRGDLGTLLDHGGRPVPGNAITVCSTTANAVGEARMGGGYRLVADLASTPPTLHAVDAQGQSGHPGSPHYNDQFCDWVNGTYHDLPLDPPGTGDETLHLIQE